VIIVDCQLHFLCLSVCLSFLHALFLCFSVLFFIVLWVLLIQINWLIDTRCDESMHESLRRLSIKWSSYSSDLTQPVGPYRTLVPNLVGAAALQEHVKNCGYHVLRTTYPVPRSSYRNVIQEAQLLLTNRTRPVCKVVEVLQDYL